jgi:membrane protein DedA with SNARE-associated domain
VLADSLTGRGIAVVTGAIEQFGALGVFLLMVPESACIPIPSELTLLFAGAAVQRGWLSLPLAVACATAGNLVGSMIAYAVGASRLLDRVPGVRTIVRRWEGLLERYGMRAVFIARLLPLARSFVSLPAGARRVELVPFIALTAAGCAIWATGFVLAGMLVGTAWATVGSTIGQVLLALGVGVVVLATMRARGDR